MHVLSSYGPTSIVFRAAPGLAGRMPQICQKGLPGRDNLAAEVENASAVDKWFSTAG